MDDKRTVRAGRRRPSGPGQGGERERADAPERQKPSVQRPTSSFSGGGGGGSSGGGSGLSGIPGGQIPVNPKTRMILVGVLVIAALCYFAFQAMNGGGDLASLPEQPAIDQPEVVYTEQPTIPVQPLPTRTPRPAKPTASGSSAGASEQGDTWLVMLYEDADDKVLEEDIYIDLNEAERVGSNEKVQIVAQVDRYQAGFQGDGDWNGTRRYYITEDQDLNRIHSDMVQDLGEANMADGQTLVDFVTWAVANYPADKFVLVLSDHGMGWPGGWSDPTARGSSGSQAPLAQALGGDHLYLEELDQALQDIRQQAGIDQFELVGMDACLMGHVEVFSMLAKHARYAVASQETEPSLGWAYSSFLAALQDDPAVNGGELGRLIVQSYISDDQRIVDDQARMEFLSRGSPLGGLFGAPSADQLASQLSREITLTAFDLSQMPAVTQALNDLSFVLQSADQRGVAKARSYAQSFTSIWGKDVPASYIDLGHFASLLDRELRDRQVSQASDAISAALREAVIAERHGPGKPGATGVSIYFPNSQLYNNAVAGAQSYTTVAGRFVEESLWDDFLAFHYSGRKFNAETRQAAIPGPSDVSRAPGAGKVSLSPIKLTSQIAAPGQPVLLSSDIFAENIAYIKLFAGFFDQQANSIFVADMDYLESADTRELNGVYYPDWGEGDFTLEFEWEPLVFAISDGTKKAVALFTPQSYGADAENAVYTVDGIYTFQGGEQRYARLYFRDGRMWQAFGFAGEDFNGAPREITPQAGDTFTILERWLDIDASGQSVEPASQQGETLTFGNNTFTWIEMDAAPGEYIVGFILEDMDGNASQVYARIQVR